MHTQFFGNYLLSRNLITKEEMLSVMEQLASTHVKLGSLAAHAGYMTASEVEHVIIMQTRQDKRFGELAVELGYMSQKQVDELLQEQVPDYILFGQILIEDGILTPAQLENYLTDYRSEYEIYDLDMNYDQTDLIHKLLQNIDFDEIDIHREYVTYYLKLLFNNLIRFIGDDFTPLQILNLPEIPTNFCVSQDMDCSVFHISSALDFEKDAAIAFASRYAKEDFTEFDEYVQASMEDFTNLHNGLFLVNMSNNYSLELNLYPPEFHKDYIIDTGKTTFLIPILFSFGVIHFIFSIYKTDSE